MGARAGKYKFGARVGKYKLGARAGKYKLGTRAGGQSHGRGSGNTNTLKKKRLLLNALTSSYYRLSNRCVTY